MEKEYKHQEKGKWKMHNKQDIIQLYIWTDIIPEGKMSSPISKYNFFFLIDNE